MQYRIKSYGSVIINCSVGLSSLTQDVFQKYSTWWTLWDSSQWSPFQKSFQNHYRNHSEELFVCEQCPIKVNTRKKLASHKFKYHSANTTCSQCSKSFSKVSNLAKHQQAHNEIYSCQSCNKTYINRTSMKKHYWECSVKLPSVKTKRVLFACNKCDKSFSKSCNLTRHIRTHSKNVTMPCTVCNIYSPLGIKWSVV